MSAAEITHGWPIVLFEVRLNLRSPDIDPFERVVLGLAAAAMGDPQDVAKRTGLDSRFVDQLVEALKGRGALDDQGRLLEVGRDLLNDEGESAVVQGYMARDGLTGQPLPAFWLRKPWHAHGRPSLGETDDDKTPRESPEKAEQGAWREAFARWQRPAREVTWKVPFGADPTRDPLIGIRFLGSGQRLSLAVGLGFDVDGRPTVHCDPIPAELLRAHLERVRPAAWVALEEEAESGRTALERARANEQIGAEVQRRLQRTFGQVPEALAEPLREALLTRLLAESPPGRLGPALTGYRKFSESFCILLSPSRRSAPAEEAANRLPKLGDHLNADLEALASPEALQLSAQLGETLGGLRKERKRPTHGRSLTAWPFWHAALDPRAPESERLRSAAQRCPSLWLELDFLRDKGNSGAHFDPNRPEVEEGLFERLDSTVRTLLEALSEAPRKAPTVRRQPPAGVPREVAEALSRAERAASNVAREPKERRAAADAFWDAGKLRLGTWQKVNDFSALKDRLQGLPTEPSRCRESVERLLDGLRPPDDDGRGYELPAALIDVPRGVQDLLNKQESNNARLLRPLLLAAWWPTEGPGLQVREALDRGDPWQVLERVRAFRLSAVRTTNEPPSEWLSRFEQVRTAVENLWRE